ncbi:MAG: hypothetical protein HYZ36_05755 [Pedosphaera parvula]|nr:hypothetical protein [Pedosphaera parvula]
MQNKLLDFATLQRLRRFARYWDLIANSGNFIETTPLIWTNAGQASSLSPVSRGSAGDPPASLGDSPSGTAVAPACNKNLSASAVPLSVPSGGSPDGTGRSPVLPRSTSSAAGASPFWSFLHFSNWLYSQLGRSHQIALDHLAERLFRYLTEQLGLDLHRTARTLWGDYQRGGRTDKPDFLRRYLPDESPSASTRPLATAPKRQHRHLSDGDFRR